MIGSLVNQMGMGLVLSWKDKMSRGINESARNLDKLKKTAQGTSEAVQKQAEKVARSAEKYRAAAFTSMKIMATGAAILAPLGLAAKSAMTMEQSMGNIRSLLVGTGMDADEANFHIDSLRKTIMATANSSKIARKEIDEAAYQLVSALGIEQAQAALEMTAQLAVSGRGSMMDAVRSVTVGMATYGAAWGDQIDNMEKANRITNTLAGTVAAFNTTLPELSEGMKFALGPSKILGVKFEEVSAFIGALQTMGLQGGRAGSSYAAMLRKMVELTDKEGKKIEDKAMNMSEWMNFAVGNKPKVKSKIGGVKLTDESGKLLPLYAILKSVEDLYGTSALKGKEALELQKAFGEEGGRAMGLLLGQSEVLRERVRILSTVAVREKMMIEIQEEAAAQWDMAKNKMKNIVDLIGIQMLPTIDSFLVSFNKMLESIFMFMDAHPDATKWIAWGTATVGALLLVGGAISSVLFFLSMYKAQLALIALTNTGASGSFSLLTAATWLWNASLYGCPVVWIIAAIIAIGAAIYFLIEYWDEISEAVVYAWDVMVDSIKVALEWIEGLIDDFLNSDVVKALRLLFEGMWEIGKAIITAPLELFSSAPEVEIPEVGPVELTNEDVEGGAQPNITDYSNHRTEVNIYPPEGSSPEEIGSAVQKVTEDKTKLGPQGRM